MGDMTPNEDWNLNAPDGSQINVRDLYDLVGTGRLSALAITAAIQAEINSHVTISLVDYGTIGGTDDAATVDAAIVAANALSDRANGEGYKGVTILVPGKVVLPNGTTERIVKDGIFFVSAAPGQAVFEVTSGAGLTIGTGAAGLVKSGGTRGIKWAAGPLGVDSTQVCIIADYASELTFYDTKVALIRQFIRAGETSARPCLGVTINGFKGSVANITGPVIDARYGYGLYHDDCDVYVSGVGYPGNTTETNASVGSGAFSNGTGRGVISGRNFINLNTGSWDTVIIGDQVITNRFDTAMLIEAVAGVVINNITLNAPFFDCCAINAIRIKCSGGTITKIDGRGGYYVAFDGHVIQGSYTGGFCETIRFTQAKSLYAGKNNYRFDSGITEISLVDCLGHGSNRLAATNTGSEQDSLVLLGSDWSVISGTYGKDAAPNLGYASQARFGVTVGPASDRYEFIGVKLAGTTAAQSGLTSHSSNGLARTVKGITTLGGTRLNGTDSAAYVIAATGVTMQNNSGFTQVYYVSGGTVTGITVNSRATGLTSGSFVLAPGDTWFITYTVAPTVNVQYLAA
jgi:hypothetical protein